jgi:TrmH family RNA methyltransferase
MITSKQNSLIKEIRSLKDKKFRDSLGVFVVEGIKPINEAIELGVPLKYVIATERALSSIKESSVKVEAVSEEVLKSVSEEVTPQGALAVAFKPSSEVQAPKGDCLLLDGVSDPSNVGAIIRTAAAAGYNEIYMTCDSADAYSQKSVRASMSGVFRVKIMRGSTAEILSVIDIPICVADMDGDSVFEFKKGGAKCLVIGNEGHGVSEEVKSKATFTVKIPMENGVESLNAAVSAGILMYNLRESAKKN